VAAGGVYAGTNPAYTSHELAHALKTSKAKFVLSAPELIGPVLKAVESVAADGGLLERDGVVVFNPHGEPGIEGHLQWGDLLVHGERDWVRFDDLETARGTTAALLFSSGTTGLPKAAMLSHYNFVAQHTLVYEAPRRPYEAVRLIALPMVSTILVLRFFFLLPSLVGVMKRVADDFRFAVPCRRGSGGAYDAAEVGREVLCYAAV
jgi:4-coumarate--CoA ligase